ncbi:hypothetical protein GCM10009837_23470 [Streptomyces durmitorensis]
MRGNEGTRSWDVGPLEPPGAPRPWPRGLVASWPPGRDRDREGTAPYADSLRTSSVGRTTLCVGSSPRASSILAISRPISSMS